MPVLEARLHVVVDRAALVGAGGGMLNGHGIYAFLSVFIHSVRRRDNCNQIKYTYINDFNAAVRRIRELSADPTSYSDYRKR